MCAGGDLRLKLSRHPEGNSRVQLLSTKSRSSLPATLLSFWLATFSARRISVVILESSSFNGL